MKAAVLVAGSWGTALATVLADRGFDTCLWTRNGEQAKEINERRSNQRFLPDVHLSERITATTDMAAAVDGAACVILAAPTFSMRQVAAQLHGKISSSTAIIHAAKGFEQNTLKRMSEVIAEELTEKPQEEIVVLSGPSHAEEVIQRQPTTVVVAAEHVESAKRAQELMTNTYFRVYTNPDVIGVEIGGALKNIMAIGGGLSDGLGFGDNAKAALLTRGLAEITRLGKAMGANPLTFAGLAGIGDLMVTCNSRHSRNWRAGYMLAQGNSIEGVEKTMGMVVEGVRTTSAAYQLAKEHGVEMPITEQLYEVLFRNKDPRTAVEDLMGRDYTHEIEKMYRSIPGA